ncbi:hypothetical protein FUAX_32120 [Fulvitalea axinellae]|uniref:Uncharacterized protein n=1 Tax=Fulvitalea axinellae TaxID=1182444 RepID=A0AAU9DI29_9BACT|nr:hypothetical protein FUAX_32120 [Fulvitalea axinellae]
MFREQDRHPPQHQASGGAPEGGGVLSLSEFQRQTRDWRGREDQYTSFPLLQTIDTILYAYEEATSSGEQLGTRLPHLTQGQTQIETQRHAFIGSLPMEENRLRAEARQNPKPSFFQFEAKRNLGLYQKLVLFEEQHRTATSRASSAKTDMARNIRYRQNLLNELEIHANNLKTSLSTSPNHPAGLVMALENLLAHIAQEQQQILGGEHAPLLDESPLDPELERAMQMAEAYKEKCQYLPEIIQEHDGLHQITDEAISTHSSLRSIRPSSRDYERSLSMASERETVTRGALQDSQDALKKTIQGHLESLHHMEREVFRWFRKTPLPVKGAIPHLDKALDLLGRIDVEYQYLADLMLRHRIEPWVPSESIRIVVGDDPENPTFNDEEPEAFWNRFLYRCSAIKIHPKEDEVQSSVLVPDKEDRPGLFTASPGKIPPDSPKVEGLMPRPMASQHSNSRITAYLARLMTSGPGRDLLYSALESKSFGKTPAPGVTILGGTTATPHFFVNQRSGATKGKMHIIPTLNGPSVIDVPSLTFSEDASEKGYEILSADCASDGRKPVELKINISQPAGNLAVDFLDEKSKGLHGLAFAHNFTHFTSAFAEAVETWRNHPQVPDKRKQDDVNVVENDVRAQAGLPKRSGKAVHNMVVTGEKCVERAPDTPLHYRTFTGSPTAPVTATTSNWLPTSTAPPSAPELTVSVSPWLPERRTPSPPPGSLSLPPIDEESTEPFNFSTDQQLPTFSDFRHAPFLPPPEEHSEPSLKSSQGDPSPEHSLENTMMYRRATASGRRPLSTISVTSSLRFASLPRGVNQEKLQEHFGEASLPDAQEFTEVTERSDMTGKVGTIYFMGKEDEEATHIMKTMEDSELAPSETNEAFANNFIRLMGRRSTAPATRSLNEEERETFREYIMSSQMGNAFRLNFRFMAQQIANPKDIKCLFMERMPGAPFDRCYGDGGPDELMDKSMLKSFGELAVYDFLLGNTDRFIGNFNEGNVMYDSQSGQVSGIDQALQIGGMEYMARMMTHQLAGPDSAGSYVSKGNRLVKSKNTSALEEIIGSIKPLYAQFFQDLLRAFLNDERHMFFDNLRICGCANLGVPLNSEQASHMMYGIVEAMLRLKQKRSLKKTMKRMNLGLDPLERQAFFNNWEAAIEAVKSVGEEDLQQKLRDQKAKETE